MARLDPAVYAEQIAEEAFIDAPESENPVDGRALVSSETRWPVPTDSV